MDIYLDGRYLQNNPLYHVEDSPWKAQQIFKMLTKHNVQMESVCEIGCGAGEILSQLQLLIPGETTFHGHEISPQAFSLCQSRENERLHFYCGDLLTRDTPRFDVLLCIDVFEHVEDYLGFLKQLRQKANYKVFHIPLDISAYGVLQLKPLIQNRAMVGHLHYFTKETALMTLLDTGYEIVDHFYTSKAIDCGGRSLRSRIARLVRIGSSKIAADFTVRLLGGYSLLVLAR